MVTVLEKRLHGDSRSVMSRGVTWCGMGLGYGPAQVLKGLYNGGGLVRDTAEVPWSDRTMYTNPPRLLRGVNAVFLKH